VLAWDTLATMDKCDTPQWFSDFNDVIVGETDCCSVFRARGKAIYLWRDHKSSWDPIRHGSDSVQYQD